MIDENDRVGKARKQYEAMQARQKRVQNARESLEKPGVLLKFSIVIIVCSLTSLGFLDPILKLLGLEPR